MPDIIVSGLSRVYPDGTYAVDDIDFKVSDGEFFTLLGPSGCGKSTTLACIAGLDTPTAGEIKIGSRTIFDKKAGIDTPCEERNVGMVFQSYALWPHMTINKNLALPLNLRKVPAAEQKRMIANALDMVDLASFGHRYPHELSGGQQQRVALARALVYSPTILLLDEPLSNLDARLRHQARAWVKRVQQELRITTIYVTHDQDEALAMSDNVAVMSKGRIGQLASPKSVYETPSTLDVAGFVGRMNFLEGVVTTVSKGLFSVALDESDEVIFVKDTMGAVPDEVVTLAFRPEKVRIAKDNDRDPNSNYLKAELIEESYVGFRYEYKFRYQNSVIEAYGDQPCAAGYSVLQIDPDAIISYCGESELRVPPEQSRGRMAGSRPNERISG